MLKLKHYALFGLLMLLLSACGNPPAALENETAEPAAASEPAATLPSNQESVVAETEPTQAAVDYCTSCHTDKQQLIDTAKPEEEVISESSGEG